MAVKLLAARFACALQETMDWHKVDVEEGRTAQAQGERGWLKLGDDARQEEAEGYLWR